MALILQMRKLKPKEMSSFLQDHAMAVAVMAPAMKALGYSTFDFAWVNFSRAHYRSRIPISGLGTKSLFLLKFHNDVNILNLHSV